MTDIHVQRPRSQIPRFVKIFSINAYNNLIFKQDQQGRGSSGLPPSPPMKKLEKYNILLVFSLNIDHDEKAYMCFPSLSHNLTPPSPSFISPRGGGRGGGTCSD